MKSIEGVLKGIWERITGRQVDVEKVKAVSKIYVKALEGKRIEIKEGKIEISPEEFEEEPKRIISEMLSELEKHGI